MATTFRVRVAWATGPFDPSPTWTDVSSYVSVMPETIDINRGRSDQISSITPSQLTLTLDNHDGRFTPGYTGSAYYPNVAISKRIQVHGTTNGSTFTPRFDGFITSLSNQWAPVGKYAEAQVTAVDLLARLGRQLVVRDVIGSDIGGAVDYWTLGDAAGATSPLNVGVINSPNAARGALRIQSGSSAGSGVTFGSATGPGTDGLTAADSLNSSLQVDHGQVVGDDATFMGFFRVVALDATFGIAALFQFTETTAGGSGICWVDNTGVVKATLTNNVGASVTLTGTSVNDGHIHHVAVTLNVTTGGTSTLTLTLWVDGVAVATNSTLDILTTTPLWRPTVWLQSWPKSANSTAEVVGAHLATYNNDVSSVVLTISDAGLTGHSPEASSVRFNRIANKVAIAPTLVGTSGTQKMGPLTGMAGRSILDLLQEVQDTENGVMYVDPAGTLTLVSRSALYNQAAAMTLTAGQYSVDLTFLADDSRLVNDATVTDATGAVQEVVNAASVTANGTFTDPGGSKTLNTVDSNEALGWAQWQVNTSTTTARISQVTVNLLTQPALVAAAWALEIGDRIDLTGLPAGAPASSVTLQVAGYTESFGADGYGMTINTQPYLTGSMFTLNDATYGKLDGPGVLSY